jgi:hypothetical protein
MSRFKNVLILSVLLFISCSNNGGKTDAPSEVTIDSIKQFTIDDNYHQPYDTLQYKKFGSFDVYSMSGNETIVDSTNVFVKESPDSVIVRLSNDMDHPFIFYRQGKYWYNRRTYNINMTEAQQQSMTGISPKIVDRYVHNDTVYEFIRSLNTDSVSQIFSVRTKDRNKTYYFRNVPKTRFYENMDIGKIERFLKDEFGVGWNTDLKSDRIRTENIETLDTVYRISEKNSKNSYTVPRSAIGLFNDRYYQMVFITETAYFYRYINEHGKIETIRQH